MLLDRVRVETQIAAMEEANRTLTNVFPNSMLESTAWGLSFRLSTVPRFL